MSYFIFEKLSFQGDRKIPYVKKTQIIYCPCKESRTYTKIRDYENAIKDYTFIINNYKGNKDQKNQPNGDQRLYGILKQVKLYRPYKFQDAINDGTMIEISQNLPNYERKIMDTKDTQKKQEHTNHLEI